MPLNVGSLVNFSAQVMQIDSSFILFFIYGVIVDCSRNHILCLLCFGDVKESRIMGTSSGDIHCYGYNIHIGLRCHGNDDTWMVL